MAVEITGKRFGPLMDAWLVYRDDVCSSVTEELVREICVVGLSTDQILIKEVCRNRKGGFDLYSNNSSEPVIFDATIEWAAKVTYMKPRR